MSTSTRRPRPAGRPSRTPDQPAASVQIAAVQAGAVQVTAAQAGDDRAGLDRAAPLAAQLLAASPAYDRQTAARLHRRLEVAADRAGLIEVAFRRVDSAVGPLLLASTDVGLVRVAFASEDHERVLTELAEQIGPRVLESPARLDEAARQLEAYLGGSRARFDLAVDLRLASGFRREVLQFLATTAYGSTYSYGEVAVAVGRPRAVRAVGTACARNPVPVVVPCHRVVRSDGSQGGYLGGEHAKALLLDLEHGR